MNILELLQQELGGAVMERLGGVLGLGANQAQTLGKVALPAQLNALAHQVNLPGGAQKLLDLAAQVPQGNAKDLISTDAGITTLRQAGAGMLPQVMGTQLESEVQRLSSETGVSSGSVQGLMQMLLPLILGWIGKHARGRGLNAAGLGGLFTGLAGVAGLGAAGLGATGLGATLGNLGTGSTTVVSPVGGASVPTPGRPNVVIAPVTSPVVTPAATYSGATGTMPHANQSLGRKPGFGWLWLLPLLLLLLLGGCFLLAGKPKTPFVVTDPAGGATIGSPFQVKGTGTAGETVTVSENGAAVASGKVDADGAYSLTVPTATAGDHSYTLAETGNDKPLDLKIKAGQPFAFTTPATSAALADGGFTLSGMGNPGDVLDIVENGVSLGKATVGADGRWSLTLPKFALGAHSFSIKGPSGLELGTLATTIAAAGNAAAGNVAAGTASAGTFAVTNPAAGAALPAGAFTMQGTGKPGSVLEIFEDGTSLGNATVGADGRWTLDVPSPAAGAHTYTVKGPDGAALGSVKATIAAAAAGTATTCTKPYSLSFKDGQSVSAPYRFGGVGSGQKYTIAVMRGARVVGSKVVTLDSSCGWSYTSNPGKGKISYAITQTGKSDVLSKITLTVK